MSSAHEPRIAAGTAFFCSRPPKTILEEPLKGAVYTVWIFICIFMSLRVFLFAKKMKLLTKGGIHCISQVFPWHFYFMREHSLVELTEHDDSAANIHVLLHS